MASGRRASGRRKVGALFMLVGLLTGTFSIFGPKAGAVTVPGDPNGTITGFEIEGNQADDGQALDWENLVGSESLTVVTDDTTDTGLQGSSKENDPAGWTCNSGGANPPKNNILHAAVNTRVGPGGAFLDLAYMREGQTGNAHINFEFNQQPIGTPCPYLTRTTGDLLLLFNFPGGDGQADVAAFLWDSTIGTDGEWVSTGVPANSAAAVSNGADVANFIFPSVTTMGNRQFGEASLNLAAIIGSDPEDCVSFGELNVRSRSSAGNLEEDSNSINSALQDRLAPTPIDLSTCGQIELQKTDDAGNDLAGATFGLFPSEADAIAETNPIDTCITDAGGLCSFNEVDPGDYWVTEISAPAGYDEDPTVVAVSVDALETVVIGYTFVDPLDTGFVNVTKAVTDGGEPFDVDPADLAGLTFILEQGGVQVNTWPPPGSPAQCSLNGVTLSCQIGPVPLGDYTVTEDPTTLPDGLSQGPDVNVTIDEDGETVQATITNPLNPININLEKAGPDTANVGDVIDYTFDVSTTGEPLTITQLVEIIDLPNHFDDRCDTTALTGPDKSTTVDADNDNDAVLEVGETWRWTCQHTVTLADATDADGALLQNKAEVTGEDSFGRDVSDDDTHTVTILLPDVTVEKTPDDGVILPGDEAEFTIVVTNNGPGRANGVTLTDDLPDGIDWSDDSASCTISPDVGTVGQVLSCDFGDLNDGATATVHVSGTTDTGDCGVLPNTAVVDATNELESASGNNDDDAQITVSCADVTVEKVAFADPINAGDDARFDITVTNLSATASATDVELEDELPDGIDWAVSGDDAGDCSIEPDSGTTDQVLACDFGTVEASGTRTITVSGETDPADCGLLTNTAVVSSSNEAAGADDNNESTDTITVQCPDLGITKVADVDVVSAGDPIGFTITVTNAGPGTAYDVTLNDPLPAGDGVSWSVESQSGGAGCAVTGAAPNQTLACGPIDLADDASFSVHVTSDTDPTGAECVGGTLPNTATADASNDAPVEASDTITVQCPDLDITKEAADGTVSAGDDIAFTITVTNDGPGTAYGVTLNDPLPAGDGVDWSIDSQDGDVEADCTITGVVPNELLSCQLVDPDPTSDDPYGLAAGESFSVTVTSPTQPATDDCVGGVLENTATADADNDAPVEATDTVEILCPGVNLNKVADDDIVEAGDPIGFTITVTNLDDGVDPAEGTATNVVVEDDLPGGLAWTVADDSDLPEGASCAILLGTLTCNLGDLPAVPEADAPQVTIHVVAPTDEADCAVYDNTATATVDNGADPDDADATSRVRCPIAIDLDKTGDTLAHVGDVVDYEFTVTNVGGEDLLDVVLTDPECDAGTITLVDDGDGDDVLAAGTWDADAEAFVGGEVWAYTCERTLTADDVVIIDGEDFALNTGAVRGEDADGRETTDTDPHVVDLIAPAIQVVKTVDDATPDVGQTVTFSYAVTNTGDTTLFDVTVVDDQLGAIGTIDELDAGETVVLTKTMVVAANSPTVNIATATGADVLGKTVTDDDPETITVVLAEVITRPAAAPAALPKTGAESQRLMLLAGALLVLGGLLVASGNGLTVGPARRRQR